MMRGVRLILASASPRRRELLRAAGIDFVVDPVDVDERRLEGEPAAVYVERLARLKATAVAARHPDAAALGADTTVVVDDAVLEKPVDVADAAAMLGRLSGRSHDVLTGFALVWQGTVASAVERTRVWVEPLSDADIRWYVGTGEPLGKAGGYAIQGLASRFIPRIEGSYTNVVGLPVAAVLQLFRATGAWGGWRGPSEGPARAPDNSGSG